MCRRIAVLLALLMVLAGCGIPERGAVQQGQAVGPAAEDTADAIVDPNPPVPGASPEQIAQGFIFAHNGTEDRFTEAKQFLTRAAQQRWNPDQGVSILAAAPVARREGSTVVVSATVTSRVTDSGRLTQLAAPARESIRLAMTRRDQEWRIDSVPASLGLWLTRADFRRLYTDQNVYYGSAAGDNTLVPDPRWMPRKGVATELAKAVLQPPPAWLDGAVRASRPPATELVGSVPVSADGVATVELSAPSLDASPEARALLWAAMAATLIESPGVAQIAITVDGTPLRPGPDLEQISDPQEVGYRPTPAPARAVILRTGDTLVWDQRSTTENRRPGPQDDDDELVSLPTVGSGWHWLACDFTTKEVAAISGDNRAIGRWRSGSLSQPALSARDLVRPAYDGINGLWVAGQALTPTNPLLGQSVGGPGPATVWVINTRAKVEDQKDAPVPVPTPGLTGQDIVALAVSPEGLRIALVLRDRVTGRSAVWLYAVVHDQDVPVRLTNPILLNASITAASDVSWIDGRSLAVLGRLSGQPALTQPIRVPINGEAAPKGAAAGAVQVVGGVLPDPRRNIAVITDRGTILTPQGPGWAIYRRGSDLVVPTP